MDRSAYFADLLARGQVLAVRRADEASWIQWDEAGAPKDLMLYPGDTVRRALADGDIAILGRQPSLHQKSIMAMRVRLIGWDPAAAAARKRVLRRREHGRRAVVGPMHAGWYRQEQWVMRHNTGHCTDLNSDFDGDTMHVHIPQSFVARAEALVLMHPSATTLSARSNTVSFRFTQNPVHAAYLLSDPRATLPAAVASGLLMVMAPEEQAAALARPLPVGDRWPGRWVLGALVPEGVALQQAFGQPTPAALGAVNTVRVCAGAWSEGRATGGVLARLLTVAHMQGGGGLCQRLIENLSAVLHRALPHLAISIGLADMLLPQACVATVRAIVAGRVAAATAAACTDVAEAELSVRGTRGPPRTGPCRFTTMAGGAHGPAGLPGTVLVESGSRWSVS